MKRRSALFQAAREDNVAVALDNLHAGQRVPLLSSDGRQMDEITLQADVPVFFKASITELHDGEEIVKHNHRIGSVVARIFHDGSSPDEPTESPVSLPIGSLIHLTNFICSSAMADLWNGNLAQAIGICFALCRPDYEFAIATKKIASGQSIRRSHVRLNPHIVGILDRLIGDDPVIGCSITHIGEGALVRLGCISPSEYKYRGDPEVTEVISRFYRFLRGRIYANS